jgi:hypothetical protein
MGDVRQAHLVPVESLQGPPASVVIERDEADSVLRTPEQPELVLQVVRDGSTHSLRVAWERGDLERVLRETEGDEIELHFAGDELAAALDDDVEAHGVRHGVAVLAVAAAAAGALAGSGSAQTTPTGGGTTPAVQGLTAQEIWAAAPASVRRAEERVEAARIKRLRDPAPYHATAVQPAGGDSGVSAPSPSDAALIGGTVLLIASAGFAARKRHHGPHQTA